LARDWPDVYQPAILTHVLADWSYFMSAFDYVRQEANAAAAAEAEGQKPPYSKKFYKFPSLRVIVWASFVAVETYEMHLQEQGLAAWSAFHKARKAKGAG
jgi:hypothetical protein